MKNTPLIITAVAAISCGTILWAEQKSGEPHVEWEYSGKNGPKNWGQLSPEYLMAKIGKNQSPINIAGASVIEAELPPIEFDYSQIPLKVLFNGHTVQAVCTGGGSIKVDGIEFALQQFHFHSPSENHIYGKSFPLEAHLVHADKDGNIAVIAVMFSEGAHNKVLAQIWANTPRAEGNTNTPEGMKINAIDLLPGDRDYYRFNGSLTTPPCSENVRWLVMKNTVALSKAQIKTLQSIIGFANNRPIQPTNARPILK
jgi:carbonic anhydrase